MSVRTRFAPSPTGYMHIGGMRTALFNWLWARHHGGSFILRIDDTDQQRNIDAALAPILHAFRWLGLHWDEGPEVGGPHGPYFQSQRGHLYQRAIEKLLAAGKAYKDFDSPDLIQADRQQAEAEKRPYLNVRRSLELNDAQRQELELQNTPFVIRLLIDRSTSVSIQDHVRDHVSWDCGLIPDPVLMRSNGTPLYNFASVVDDLDLQITHVIRAEEHLSNTAVQALIFQALGARLPEFAHIPFVAAPGTSKKLSKRDLNKYRTSPQFKKLFEMADRVLPKIGLAVSESLNPVMVSFYEEMGFLPDAIINALARLGWSLDDRTEIMPREFIVEQFTLDRVVKASAGLDPDKLLAFQEHWMGQLTADEKLDGVLPYLCRAGWTADAPSEQERQFVKKVISSLGDRLKVFSDILNYEEFFIDDDLLQFDEAAVEKRLNKSPESATLLREFRQFLASAFLSDSEALEAATNEWLIARGRKMGDLVHGLRLALTGKTIGLGLFQTIELLGVQRCLTRIDRLLARWPVE